MRFAARNDRWLLLLFTVRSHPRARAATQRSSLAGLITRSHSHFLSLLCLITGHGIDVVPVVGVPPRPNRPNPLYELMKCFLVFFRFPCFWLKGVMTAEDVCDDSWSLGPCVVSSAAATCLTRQRQPPLRSARHTCARCTNAA